MHVFGGSENYSPQHQSLILFIAFRVDVAEAETAADTSVFIISLRHQEVSVHATETKQRQKHNTVI